MYEIVRHKKSHLRWHHVRGHAGIPGNERCDQIAVSFSQNTYTNLYEGSIRDYSHDLFMLPEKMDIPEMSYGISKVTLGYLSLVNGKLTEHKNWSECEAHVKGRSGAKFKKFSSREEADEILKSWGVK